MAREDLMEYIKTDKNGTKYFADWTCPRCGGAGEAKKWEYTGLVCWGCGGSGKRAKPIIVKEYTPEYEAKLEVRRKARADKQITENTSPSEDELMQRADEARRNNWEYEGFNRDGIGYLHTGDTYQNRSKLQAHHGRWNNLLRGYIVRERIEGMKGVDICEIHAQDLCNDYGTLDIDNVRNFAERRTKK